MKQYKVLNIKGAILDKEQLKLYLEKIAITHNIKNKSNINTYPIPRVLENYKCIMETYNLLNEHIKLGINIHPAGEWLLDNFYIIEEAVKSIKKELTLKKYKDFVGIRNGKYAGFARIYVLSYEIIAFSDNKVKKEELEELLKAYQSKKNLSMDEVWNIGIFLQIAIIENIREICEKIYNSQIKKYKVESIIERLVENKPKNEQKFKPEVINNKMIVFDDLEYSFIEYMSYALKKYGKKAYGYLNILEEEVEKTGMTVGEVIKKEHFDIAVQKVSIGNCITGIKTIQRINFLEVFQNVNSVEELLKSDPANVYEKMDYKTKENYRNKIKEISNKTKISEIYVTKKIIELAGLGEVGSKKSHIGYYLIDKGINDLYKVLNYRNKAEISNKNKVKIYISSIIFFTVIISFLLPLKMAMINKWLYVLSSVFLFIPVSELVIQIIQFILGKIIKPKQIPKIDFINGIDSQNKTFVVIPTIIKTRQKVIELARKLEVYYISNKSDNIYFGILGDCSESEKKEEEFDKDVIDEGLKQVKRLNEKYGKEIFHFLYRERLWNEKENSYLGWERKRGILNQFNEFLLRKDKGNFIVNTLEDVKELDIKYVITLDSDTDLILNSAFELIGAMAHILNKPIIDEKLNVVTDGYGLIQPRVGINLDVSYKNSFTKIFAGSGGIDSYTNAISDIYQDNFGEGIFTGKGIYDLKVFSKVLKNTIPENTVLSHDLLEGSYLRCGLATDILLMDGYPAKYTSFMMRLSRWIRGDWQIKMWSCSKVNGKRNPLNLLSRYKIFDNLRRSLLEFSIITKIIFFEVLQYIGKQKFNLELISLYIIVVFPFILEFISHVIGKRVGEKKQKTFTPKIDGIKGIVSRAIITLGCLPYKAYVSICAIVKTLYRLKISHKNLLEWTTSEEAEKNSKTDMISYYKIMIVNVLVGGLFILFGLIGSGLYRFFQMIIGLLWIVTPGIMCSICKENKEKAKIKTLNKKEKEYIFEIGKRTWQFFCDYLTEENNYLMPDNYQENRVPIIVNRTSSTNIGLSLLAVISSYDLGYITLQNTITLLQNIINTIESLPKWNGHLYNWYDTKTKQPLIPRYISTVDSGNFVGYMYVVKQFLEEIKCGKRINQEDNENMLKHNKGNTIEQNQNEKLELNQDEIEKIIETVSIIIDNTDFSVLYSPSHRLFSIGFNIEDNKLTDSYYDLLASEARQASLIAIAKKDVPSKHWNNLSRTMTVLNKYKGLISWSGTSFEYLMPNINIPRYKGSLLDESCKFLIMSQIEYSKKMELPWGISEAAFNLKDLHLNYQYKAFGLPWLGLKRGLADDLVISSYGSILAITDKPKAVIANLKELEKKEMYNKYGFYESIDYTPARLKKGEKYCTVKTYMAHHQGLILLSINNLFNNNILQKRFVLNPEIEAVSILLQERMPETFVTTKENKEKVEKIKYKDYEGYVESIYTSIDKRILRGNVISSEDYTIAINQKGRGFSKYKDIYINRYKSTDDYPQGIFFFIKNIRNKKIWSTNYEEYLNKPEKFVVSFMPDKDNIERIDENVKTKQSITISQLEPVEIRKIELENLGNSEEILELTSFFEPVLSTKEQDYAHQSFNNLFLTFEYDEQTKSIKIKRKIRNKGEKEITVYVTISTNCEVIGETEYEIEKDKFIGRGNLGIPQMIKQSTPFSKKTDLVTEPVVAIKNIIRIKPNEKAVLNLIISVEEDEEIAFANMKKYQVFENAERVFELSKAKVEAESRYLQIKGKDIEIYQKMLSYMLFDNPIKKQKILDVQKQVYYQKELWKFGISGDYPIILIRIKDINDSYVINQALKAYEFFKVKNINVEIIILNEEKYSYENYIVEEIEKQIYDLHLSYLKNVRCGIFVLNQNEISKNDVNLLKFVADLEIDASKGDLETIINDCEKEYLDKLKLIGDDVPKLGGTQELQGSNIDILENTEKSKYLNEYGTFSEDGKEYRIRINKQNKLPTVWSHVIANKKFGTVVTENMGGYSWSKNSRLNRITAWNNSACLDIPSEVIYLKDMDSKNVWSMGCNPMADDNNYNVIYGFGYAKYIHSSFGLEQISEIFVPQNDGCKVNIVTLKNTVPSKRKIKLVYYLKPVLSEDEIKSNKYININYEENNNIICVKNLYNKDNFENIMYVSSSEKIKSYTGDKSFFLGEGGISNPDGMRKTTLNRDNGIGKESCVAIELEIELESFETKEISLVFGAEDNLIDSKKMAYKYGNIANCKFELEIIKNYWRDLLSKVQITTPIESINILLNGWCMYQTISCRLWGRSGFYQSGGAFGFRDQLQDSLSTKYLDIEMLKNQIIEHSKHQFIEGDVEHWWHDETKRGIRTRFSDDLLWLPYAIIQYIMFTGNNSILEEKTKYLMGRVLNENEAEKYDIYYESDVEESIYLHCIKAIEKALNFGENKLPKIGIGDWNDGLSEVGSKGKGESVWLGFFLYYILEKFIPICKKMKDFEKVQKFSEIKKELKRALNSAGWDGRWYKRAFTDDGEILGSIENEECKIDSIAQTWSVISNAGDNDKKYISMESLENHLIDRENGIIKLLDPPFEKSKLEPRIY